jgi:hypothetical protein
VHPFWITGRRRSARDWRIQSGSPASRSATAGHLDRSMKLSETNVKRFARKPTCRTSRARCSPTKVRSNLLRLEKVNGRTKIGNAARGKCFWRLFLYCVVVGAAGPAGAGAVSETIGADGRIVDDPTVVLGAVSSATRGPLQGAHIKRTAITAAAAISPISPPPMPVRSVRSRLLRFRLLRPESRNLG